MPLPLSSYPKTMAFSRFAHRPTLDRLAKFWPLSIVILIGILYGIQMHLSMSKMIPDPNTQQSMHSTPQANTEHIAAQKGLAYPVALSLIHYATSNITPQQSREEVMVTVNILARKAPCNFLVFGLGYDSLMWQTLNHGGNTVFLEEDPHWIANMARLNPNLRSIAVNYTTMLNDAEELLEYSRREKETCSPAIDLPVSSCKLAIKTLPEEIYKTKWDVIMIDAPTGYFPEAPGRMSAIYSAAVMAKGRDLKTATDILVHDVDRDVERIFSTEFFCSKNLIEAVGKIWHFELFGDGHSRSNEFCRKTSKTQSS